MTKRELRSATLNSYQRAPLVSAEDRALLEDVSGPLLDAAKRDADQEPHPHLYHSVVDATKQAIREIVASRNLDD